jgi:hypothetical protein
MRSANGDTERFLPNPASGVAESKRPIGIDASLHWIIDSLPFMFALSAAFAKRFLSMHQ